MSHIHAVASAYCCIAIDMITVGWLTTCHVPGKMAEPIETLYVTEIGLYQCHNVLDADGIRT